MPGPTLQPLYGNVTLDGHVQPVWAMVVVPLPTDHVCAVACESTSLAALTMTHIDAASFTADILGLSG